MQPIDLAAVRVPPEPPAPLPAVRALHTHAVGTTGVFVALAGLLTPSIAVLANPAFVDALLWNADATVRVQHFHQLVTLTITSLCVGILGIGAAHVGKGPLAAAVDDTVRPAA